MVAAFEARSGDLATAPQTITDVLAGPVSGIAAVLSEATQAFEEFLTTEFNGLITTLPAVLFSAVQTVLSGNLQSLIDTLGDALSACSAVSSSGRASAVPAAAAVVVVGNSPANRAQSALPAAAEVPAAVAPVAVSVAVSARGDRDDCRRRDPGSGWPLRVRGVRPRWRRPIRLRRPPQRMPRQPATRILPMPARQRKSVEAAKAGAQRATNALGANRLTRWIG